MQTATAATAATAPRSTDATQPYFDNLDKSLAGIAGATARTDFLAGQVRSWERRYVDLQRWAQGAHGVAHPFAGELDSWAVESVIRRLRIMRDAARPLAPAAE